MSEQISEATARPWSREALDLHVKQRLREAIEMNLVIEQDDDDTRCPRLSVGKEDAGWRTIRQAIEDAGWHICSGDHDGSGTLG